MASRKPSVRLVGVCLQLRRHLGNRPFARVDQPLFNGHGYFGLFVRIKAALCVVERRKALGFLH
jgi:hypothetical protein